MPSDERDLAILRRLAPAVARFRSALALTTEQVRGLLDEAGVDPEQAAPARARDLGAFAAGRIDMDRFGVLLESRPRAATADASLLQRAFALLTELLDREDGLLTVRVERGASLVGSVRRALTEIGRAFGAARAVSPLTRESERDPSLLEGLPFARWNRAERDLAPPLLVHVDGADCHADGLAEFLDGSLKLVLRLRDAGPAAPLARLITPGVFVLQDGDDAALDGLAAWSGPGVAALVGEGAARFVHDPDGGALPGDRLRVLELPSAAPTAPCGARSVRQQLEELRHLAALGQGGTTPAGASTNGVGSDPIASLAAWLLSQSDLTDIDSAP